MIRWLRETLFPRVEAKPAPAATPRVWVDLPHDDIEDDAPVLLPFPAPRLRLRLLDLHEECDEPPPACPGRVGRALAALRGAGGFCGEGEGI